MQVLPIDLEAIIAIVLGMSIVLIPVAGLTLRFALDSAGPPDVTRGEE